MHPKHTYHLRIALILLFALTSSTQALPPTPSPAITIYAVHHAKQALIDAGYPLHSNIVLITQSALGSFPMQGPHIMDLAPGGRKAYIQRHLTKLRLDIKRLIPNPNATGLAVIDYESWWPFWSAHYNAPSNLPQNANDQDFKDDWRDHIRTTHHAIIPKLNQAQQESLFATTWLAATKDFWQATLAECQRLRPNMTWGYYGLPIRDYWKRAQNNLPALEEIKQAHDVELAWLWDQSDALYPSIYTFYQSVPIPKPKQGQDIPLLHANYIRENIAEALRLAKGKPVYPFLWWRYHDSNKVRRRQFLNPINLKQSIEIPIHQGVAGLIFWDLIPTDQDRIQTTTYIRTQLLPLINNLPNN